MSDPITLPRKDDANVAAPSRKPYEPPAIEESSQFETLALACANNSGLDCQYGAGVNDS